MASLGSWIHHSPGSSDPTGELQKQLEDLFVERRKQVVEVSVI